MVKQRVRAILSDYDGTLVPTYNVKSPKENVITNDLEEILKKISTEIPVCVISTKDFEFLRKKTSSFARMLSCMAGIETVVLTNLESPSSVIVKKRLLYADLATLEVNSEILNAIAQEVISQEEFHHLLIEYKHTTDGILAGLTIDWRNSNDWSYYGKCISHFISKIISSLKREPVPINLYVQQYSTHPFIDIYSIECNKGMAFDNLLSELALATTSTATALAEDDDNNKSVIEGGTLYLGDSENDNPAFRKADVSIGIRSDARLNPKLDCSYFLHYKELAPFLMSLRENDYVFTGEILASHSA